MHDLRYGIVKWCVQNLNVLKRLLETPGPSGFESRVAQVWATEARLFASVEEDHHGSVYATINRGLGLKVMLSGHLDEIGLMISHVDDKGIARVKNIGGWDANILLGQRVRVMARGGDLMAVVGCTPVHLQSGDAKEAGVKIKDLWLDFGLSGDEVKSKVRVGDVAVIEQPVLELGERLVSKALDNRLGAFIALEAIRRLSQRPCLHEVTAVATSQEEIGAHGASIAAFKLEPHLAIALDLAFESTQPNVNPQEIGEAPFGSGVNIVISALTNSTLNDMLIAIAIKHGINTTLCAEPRATGTDADLIAVHGKGTPSASLGVPSRYMHSPCEMVQLSDVEACIDLLVQFILELPADADFSRRI